MCQDWLQILSTLLLNSLPETGIKRSLPKAALVVFEKMELHAQSLSTAVSQGGSLDGTLKEVLVQHVSKHLHVTEELQSEVAYFQ